jgi:hypothetical protein
MKHEIGSTQDLFFRFLSENHVLEIWKENVHQYSLKHNTSERKIFKEHPRLWIKTAFTWSTARVTPDVTDTFSFWDQLHEKWLERYETINKQNHKQ